MSNQSFLAKPENRKKIKLTIICTLASVCTILLLYTISNKANHRPNGFIRLFPPHVATPEKILDIRYNSFYIAGATDSHIYLGNSTGPAYILITDYTLSDTSHLELQLADTARPFKRPPLLAIDSPHIYMTEGFSSTIRYGALPKLAVHPFADTTFFFSATALSPSSFVLRAYDSARQQSILTKYNRQTATLQSAPNALEKQVDGFFCTDGALHFEPHSGRIVYVYYYRNSFLSLDTNMNIQYKGHTIDTTSQVKIKVAHVTSTEQITLTGPPAMVNRLSCVDSNWIYVNSKLLANNEDKALFDKCSVVDVYSIKDGKYHCSFYLPDRESEKVRAFRVFDNTLVALYDHYLYTYKLDFTAMDKK